MRWTVRYVLMGSLIISFMLGLSWRIISLHIFEKSFLQGQGDARTMRVVNTPAYRGMITDRNGEPLAISTPVQSVWLNPKEFSREHPHLLALASYLDISLDQLMEKLSKNQSREFVYLQRHITPKIAENIKELAIPGIHLKSEYRRFYPSGEVSAHIVGFTDLDDQGKEGLELAYDTWLKGCPGSKRVLKDRMGREVQTIEGLKDAYPGKDIKLSVDQRLQYVAYRELKSVVNQHSASAGTAIILDVKTGEILAMVNQPSFNPNIRIKVRTDNCFRNRAVTDIFEPGSVAKTFSVVNAMQYGGITPATLIDTSPGWMHLGKHTVREDKRKNHGLIDVAQILQKSSNVGVSKLTLALPPERLWETYRSVGFGSTTGCGFPGESTGTLPHPPKQASFVLATMSFGYGMSVTPLQLAQAYAILGAGGVRRPCTFIKVDEIPEGERVLKSNIARQAVDMLTTVVEQGSGSKAKVVGYHIAGKTGTVRKIAASGGYEEKSHVAVFAGLAPATDPRFAIVVVIDDPKGLEYYGSQVAAPLFSRIASSALRIYNIAPDREDLQFRIATSEMDVEDLIQHD